MENTVPHPAPRHRTVRHPPVLAIAPARGPRAPGEGVSGERGARGHQRTGHRPVTRRQDGGGGPAHARTDTRGTRGRARVPLATGGRDAHETPRRLFATAWCLSGHASPVWAGP